MSEKTQSTTDDDEPSDDEEQPSGDARCRPLRPGGIRSAAKPPKNDSRREELDSTVASEAQKGRTARSPSRCEGDDDLKRHPRNGQDLKPDDALEDVGGFGYRDAGHLLFHRTTSTPTSLDHLLPHGTDSGTTRKSDRGRIRIPSAPEKRSCEACCRLPSRRPAGPWAARPCRSARRTRSGWMAFQKRLQAPCSEGRN